jgi:hypothetical protein
VEIRSSTWQFAILEMIHLMGLTMLLGTPWVLDMRARLWHLQLPPMRSDGVVASG